MKKFLKVFGITIFSLFIIFDILFCTVLPNVIHLEKYKEQIQKIAAEQAQINLEYDNAKIITTPLLSAGIQIDNLSLMLPDGSLLFSTDKIKTRISLPSLLLFTVKLSCLEIDKPFLNLEIAKDNSNFKIVSLTEKIINEQKQSDLENPKTETQTQDEMMFDLSKIRIKIPNAVLKDYKILINDLSSGHYLDLKGDKLILGYFNGKSAKIKTFAQLHNDENVNINANIDINSFLPEIEPSLDEEDDEAQKIEIPFVNPVQMYRNYDLKANLYAKLRIQQDKNGLINTFGYTDLEGITIKLSGKQLPESYIKTKAIGSNLWIDTNISAVKNQQLCLNGKINYGKHPNANLKIKTDKIYFNDLKILTEAFLNSLHIKNELNKISTSGFLKADALIKSDFKKLYSDGQIVIKDGALKVKNLGNIISDTNINLLFNNNSLDIKNSSLSVNNSKINISGNIDEKSFANISIKSQPINLSKLFYAFAPENIRNQYNLSSGNLTFAYILTGKLKNAENSAAISLDNLKISDRSNSFIAANKKFAGEFNTNMQNTKANILNNNFEIFLPATKSKFVSDKIELSINNESINIKENNIYINDKSKISYSGNIDDYTKKQNLSFNAEGFLNTSDLIKLIGKELASYFSYSGNLPFNATVNGNSKKQTLHARLSQNTNNYITPIIFTDTMGKDTVLQTVLDFKPNRIKIKNTGLFSLTSTVDENGNKSEKLNDIISLDGTIAKDTINLLKISIPESINAKIHIFPKSSLIIEPAKILIFGKTNAPLFYGTFNINNLFMPELLTSISDINFDFKGHSASFNLDNILLNESDINLSGATNLLPENILKIFDLNISSKLTDVDKITKVLEKTTEYFPQQTSSANNTKQSADIPVVINNGTLNIDNLKTGNINIFDIHSNIILKNNIFYLRNLVSKAFDGKIGGNISVNLLSSLLKINLSGSDINVKKALLDAAGMKDTLSGKASFKTNLTLCGSTYEEQMKNLEGNVIFNIFDGQFGPFGKIENLIIAENIRKSEFFKTALGGIVESLATIDTTHFSEFKGTINFKDGICHIDELTSAGKILAMHIFGDFDLLNNTADMKVRAKMTSIISNLLGPIAIINPVNLINSAAGINPVTAKAFSLFCETITDEEAGTIPNFSNKYIDNSAMKFQLVVKGDAAKPLTLIKSFKWLATAFEFNKADEFVASIPEIPEGSTAATIEELIKETEAIEKEKQTLKYKIMHIFTKKDRIKQ